MRYFIVLLLLALCGCNQPTTDTPSTADSPTPEATQEKERAPDDGPADPLTPYQESLKLSPHQSSITWPEGELELTPSDKVGVTDWIGGVAGTDSNSVTVFGDGKVRVDSGREGGPGGKDTSAQGQLSPEETRAVFNRLRESKLLEQEEAGSGTTGSTLFVEFQGKTDRVSVVRRRSEAARVLGNAASVVEKSDK